MARTFWARFLETPLLELDGLRKNLLERMEPHSLGRVRPWKEFFRGFSLPSLQGNRVLLRIATNLVYYSGNYLVIAGILLMIQMLWDPLFALCIFAILSLWICLLILYSRRKREDPPAVDPYIYWLGGLLVSCFLLSGFQKVYTLMGCFFVQLFFVIAHSCFRKRSLRSKVAWRSTRLPYGMSFLKPEGDLVPLVVTSSGDYEPTTHGVNGAMFVRDGQAPVYDALDSDSC